MGAKADGWDLVAKACHQLREANAEPAVDAILADARDRIREGVDDPRPRQLALSIVEDAAAIARARLQVEAELRTSTESRDALLSGVAHDLRNPLNTFAMSTGLLRDDVTRGDIDSARELNLVQRMERSVDRMRRLIEDLLDASRLEAKKVTLHPTPLAAADVARSAVAQAAPLASERGAMVVLGPVDPSARVVADRARIEQLLAKIIAATLRLETEGGTVELTVETREANVVFVIQGSAAGPPSSGASLEGRGGLGLLVARALARLHDGAIQVLDGSTVCVSLPAAPTR